MRHTSCTSINTMPIALSPTVSFAASLLPFSFVCASSILYLSVSLLYVQRMRSFQCCPLTHYSLPHEMEVMRCYIVQNFRGHVTDKVTDCDVFVDYIRPWTVWHVQVCSRRVSLCNELLRWWFLCVPHLYLLCLSCHLGIFFLGGGIMFRSIDKCCQTWLLTLRLLMSYIYIYIYIYGASSKARNANVVYIWTYVWQRWNSLFLFAAQCFNTESMQRGFLCHICV